MSRVPSLPYRVTIQKHAPNGGTLPPLEQHSFANLAQANQCRDDMLRRPSTRVVSVVIVIDEATPASQAAALEALERQREAHKLRIAGRV